MDKTVIYRVVRIDEDVDFGCEERKPGAPVMAVVTLESADGECWSFKQEDQMLYERSIDEGDYVIMDEEGKLKHAM